jgi:hypothetical protein
MRWRVAEGLAKRTLTLLIPDGWIPVVPVALASGRSCTFSRTYATLRHRGSTQIVPLPQLAGVQSRQLGSLRTSAMASTDSTSTSRGATSSCCAQAHHELLADHMQMYKCRNATKLAAPGRRQQERITVVCPWGAALTRKHGRPCLRCPATLMRIRVALEGRMS